MSMTPSKLVQHSGTVSLQILSSPLTPKEKKKIKIHFHFCLPPVYHGSPTIEASSKSLTVSPLNSIFLTCLSTSSKHNESICSLFLQFLVTRDVNRESYYQDSAISNNHYISTNMLENFIFINENKCSNSPGPFFLLF